MRHKQLLKRLLQGQAKCIPGFRRKVCNTWARMETLQGNPMEQLVNSLEAVQLEQVVREDQCSGKKVRHYQCLAHMIQWKKKRKYGRIKPKPRGPSQLTVRINSSKGIKASSRKEHRKRLKLPCNTLTESQ